VTAQQMKYSLLAADDANLASRGAKSVAHFLPE